MVKVLPLEQPPETLCEVSLNQVSEDSFSSAVASWLYHKGRLSPAAVAAVRHAEEKRGTSAGAVDACLLCLL